MLNNFYLNLYSEYYREVIVDFDEIWWVTNSLVQLLEEGFLSQEEAQSYVDSLYYGQYHKDFIDAMEDEDVQ